MFKICTVGCGNMSTSGHGPSYAKYKKDYPDTCLAACCDLDESKAKEYAETEFEKYRIIQDRIFESDFDHFSLPTLPFEEEQGQAAELLV